MSICFGNLFAEQIKRLDEITARTVVLKSERERLMKKPNEKERKITSHAVP